MAHELRLKLRPNRVRDHLSTTRHRKEITMYWSKPEYQDLRFGFEITMYISAR
jgi:coenzyme PQQ precursor peptide PqqA